MKAPAGCRQVLVSRSKFGDDEKFARSENLGDEIENSLHCASGDGQ